MLFYWCLLVVITFNTIVGYRSKKISNKRTTLFISFLLLFVIAAIRKDIGVDYSNYYDWYRFFSRGGTLSRDVEIGYLLLNDFCIKMGLGFNGLIVISSFFCYFPIYYLAREINKPLILYVCFLLYYAASFALIRQSIAISFAILCTYYYLRQFYTENIAKILVSKKKRHFFKRLDLRIILLAIVACSFHYSLILYFLLIFFGSFVRLKTRVAVPLLIVSFAVALNATAILNFVIEHFSTGTYARYFEKGHLFFKQREIGSGLGIILRYVVYIVSFMLCSSLLKERSKQEISIFNWLFIALVGIDALSIHSEIFIRFKFLFQVSFLIPLFYMDRLSIANKNKYFLHLCGIAISLLYLILFKYSNDIHNWKDLPYTTLFF